MDIAVASVGVSIRIKEFFPALENARDPNSRVVDWVSYYPANQAGQTLVTRRVESLLNIEPLDDPQNPMLSLAHQRKQVIEPAYRAWKLGNEMPVNGLPLKAWHAITPQHADIIHHAGIRTVEELADSLDSVVMTIKLPNPRDLRTLAQRYIASKDVDAAAKRLEEAESLAAAQRDHLAEMANMMRVMQAEIESLKKTQIENLDPDDERVPSRRRKKVIEEAEADKVAAAA